MADDSEQADEEEEETLEQRLDSLPDDVGAEAHLSQPEEEEEDTEE